MSRSQINILQEQMPCKSASAESQVLKWQVCKANNKQKYKVQIMSIYSKAKALPLNEIWSRYSNMRRY